MFEIIVIVVLGVVIIVVVWKFILPKLGPLFGVTPPPPPPPVPVTPPVVTPPVVIPPIPSVPTMSFVNPPNQVVAGIKTNFTFYTEFSGSPARRESTKFIIAVPANNGVFTALVGNGSRRWDPTDGVIEGTQDTAGSDFPTVNTGQINVEIYIDHVTPNGEPPDCKLTAINVDSGTSITISFRGVSP